MMLKEQNLLYLASQINTEINKSIDKHAKIFTSAPLDMNVFEQRANNIEYYSNVLAVLTEQVTRLSEIVKTAKIIQNQDYIAIENKMNKLDISKAPKKNPVKTQIEIIDGIKIPAIKITSPSQVKTSGDLYYIEANNIFLVRICGVVYYGNIGNIHSKNPIKIKECVSHEPHKYDTCRFYHPPTKFTGSKDVRNFTSYSWVYTPSTELSTRLYTRRIGSRDNLSADLANIDDVQITMFNSQVIHDLLCSLVIQYNKPT